MTPEQLASKWSEIIEKVIQYAITKQEEMPEPTPAPEPENN